MNSFLQCAKHSITKQSIAVPDYCACISKLHKKKYWLFKNECAYKVSFFLHITLYLSPQCIPYFLNRIILLIIFLVSQQRISYEVHFFFLVRPFLQHEQHFISYKRYNVCILSARWYEHKKAWDINTSMIRDICTQGYKVS